MKNHYCKVATKRICIYRGWGLPSFMYIKHRFLYYKNKIVLKYATMRKITCLHNMFYLEFVGVR